ncbi:hypothetical protein PG994_012874 [Apiospora phragmitis]|uniref:Uncharacterized protein n=1 Tax=Apiospora phragmitis TaxID=2905665 RepID=A0ABR1T720_9PEZI
MDTRAAASDPTAPQQHVSIRSTRRNPLDRIQERPAKRRVSVGELPILGSLKSTSTLSLESLDPKLRKVARKIAKGVWKGTKVSVMLICIAPYLPMVLFLVLCDWAKSELHEFLVKEDVDSISDWSKSTLVG